MVQKEKLLLYCMIIFITLDFFLTSIIITTTESLPKDRIIKDKENLLYDEIDKSSIVYDKEYCKNEGSLNSIALNMIRTSSISFEKLKNVLSQSQYFFIDLALGETAIFQDITKNIITMMEGYGKTQLTTASLKDEIKHKEQGVIAITGSFFHSKFIAKYETVNIVAMIIIQTEQVAVLNSKKFISQLQSCHTSTTCIVWEYSDYNYKWMKDNLQMKESVTMIPLMIQNRMKPFVPNNPIPIQQRSIKLSFYGLITKRRAQFKQMLESNLYTIGSMNATKTLEENGIIISKTRPRRSKQMANHYAQSKVCLIIHSFSDICPGEYHRLSEIAPFGCVVLSEKFGDEFAIDIYEKCGGVVFFDQKNFLAKLNSTFFNISDNPSSDQAMMSRIEWWEHTINWENLLIVGLGE